MTQPTDTTVHAHGAGARIDHALASTRPSTAAPTHLGRHRVEQRLGSGGMGVVFAAHDPLLDRRVAIKLLHGQPDPRVQARLAREAQALARINHPNVIEVYGVETHAGQPYVIMELVDGDTLDRWLHARSRPSTETLRVCIDAGRGLAAAHAAGLVHRDFKPSNVMVGNDGRVRVLDFGLARAAVSSSDDGGSARAVPTELARTGSLELSLTKTGKLLGTPAYMAPELYQGRPATASSDQFAFCVTLYQALYRQHPFSDTHRWEVLLEHVLRGEIRPAPPGSRVPERMREIVCRGLRIDPAARWPSMAVLLHALASARRRPRRAIAAASSAVVLTVGLGIGFPTAEPTVECPGEAEALAGVWDEAQRQALTRAFEGSGNPLAASTEPRVQAALDAYGQRWAQARTVACGALTDQGQALAADRRLRCLDERRDELGALVEQLLRADEATVTHALQAVALLEPVARCARADATAEPALDLLAPARREAIEQEQARLRRAAVLDHLGRYDDALAIAREVGRAAVSFEHAPLEIAAALLEGELLEERGDLAASASRLEHAFFAAQRLGDDRQALRAALGLASGGFAPSRPDQDRTWVEQVCAIATRLGDDPDAQARCSKIRGDLAMRLGELEDALERYQEALDRIEGASGEIAMDITVILNNSGVALRELGRPEQAKQAYARALALREQTLGPDHPKTAAALYNVANAHIDLGDDQSALSLHRRALEIRERTLGPTHHQVASSCNAIGILLDGANRSEEAIAHYHRAIAIWEQTLGDAHPNLAHARTNLTIALAQQGSLEEAIEQLRSAVGILERAYGEHDARLAHTLALMGKLELHAGRSEAAQRWLERALALDGIAELPEVKRTEWTELLAEAKAAVAAEPSAARP